MKIIITENQLDKILSSEKHRRGFIMMIDNDGIIYTSNKFGMDHKEFIDKVFGEFDNVEVINMIKKYIKYGLTRVFPLNGSFDCERYYEDPENFFNAVSEIIIEYCYLNYYDKLIPDSDDSIEWGNIWLRIHRYLELNFQDEIKDWYIQNCIE